MKRILIVDDTTESRYLLEKMLHAGGYETASAPNGAEALAAALKKAPDMIVSDILMPVMDGFTLCREWRRNKTLQNIPFVFYTATYTDRKDEVFALNLGADAFIVKPQEMKDLLSAIQEIFHKHTGKQAHPKRSRAREEKVFLKEYNEVLVRKLEDKIAEVEATEKELKAKNAALEQDVKERKQAEEALALFRYTFKSISECISITDTHNVIQFVNQAFSDTYGYTPEELIGKHISLVSASSDVSPSTVLRKTLSGGWQGELLNRKKDGTVFPISLSTSVVYDEKKHPVALVGVAIDITERKQAEARIRESEEKYRALVTQSPDGIFVVDLEGRFLSVNESMCRELQFTEKELLSMKIWDVVPTQYKGQFQIRLAQILKGERVNEASEYEVLAKDGKARCVEVVSAPYYRDQKLVGFQGIARDISERKRIQQELQEREKQLSSVFDTVADVIFLLDVEGKGEYRFASVNRAFHTVTGIPAEAVVGKRVRDVIPESSLTLVLQKYNQAIRDKTVVRWEETTDYPTGRLTGEVSVAPLFDEDGRCSHLVGAVHDITERKRSEEALANERNLLRTLIDNLRDFVYIKDTKGRFLLGNRAVARHMGAHSPDELVGKTDWDFYPKEQVARFQADEETVLKTGRALIDYDERNVDAEGNERWILTTKLPLLDTSGQITGLVGIGHDISERKRAEEDIRESEQRYREFFDTSRDCVFITSVDGHWVDMNDAALEMFGYSSREELMQVRIQDLYATAEDRGKLTSQIAAQGYAKDYPVDLRRKDGQIINTQITSSLRRGEGGNVTGFMGTVKDVTERKRLLTTLQKERNLLRTMIDTIPDRIYAKDTESRFIVCNKAVVGRMGMSSVDEIMGKSDFDFLPHELAERFRDDELAIMRSGQPLINREEPMDSASGVTRWNLATKVPLRDDQGTIIGIVGMGRDITERKLAEEALRASEEKFRELFDSAPVGYHELDMKGCITKVNYTELDMLGYAYEEMIGRPIWEFVADGQAERTRMLAKLAGELERDKNAQRDFVRKDGATLPVLSEDRPLTNVRGEIVGIRTVIQDITIRKRMEDALRHEKALMDALMDNVPDSIYFKDRQCRLVRINRRMMQSLNLRSMDEAIGKTDVELFGEEFGRGTLVIDQKLVETGQPVIGLLESRQLEGGQLNWTLTSKVPLRDPGGRITGLVGVTREINDLMNAQKSLRDNEQRLKVALTCADIAVFNQDRNLRYTWMFNPQLGFLPQEVLGKTDAELLPGADVSRAITLKQNVLESGVGAQDEVAVTLDHQQISILLSVEPLRDSAGEIIGLTGAMIDITNRKRAEEAVRESEERYRMLFSHLPDALYVHVDTRVVLVNPAMCALLGARDPSQLLGLNVFDVVHPDFHEIVRGRLKKIFEGRQVPLLEEKYVRLGGDVVDVEVSAVLIDWHGVPGVQVIARDITDRKKAEEVLRRYELLSENARDVIIFVRAEDGQIIEANTAATQTYGYSREEFRTLSIRDIRHPDTLASVESQMAEAYTAGIFFETLHKRKDGTVLPVEVSSKGITLGNSRILISIIRDITERKKTETALRDSETKYKGLFEKNLAGTFVSTPSGVLLDCNPAYERMFGFASHEQAMAINMHRLYADPKDREQLLDTLREHTNVENFQLRMIRMDGTPMYVIANVVGRFDENGRLAQKTGYLIDDTKRHRLERELIQAQKLESLGILAGGIAHDFNNILGILMGHVSLLERIKDNPDLHRVSLNAIDTALKRGTSLVRQLLTFARKTESTFDSVLVNDVVKELFRLLRETFPKTIEIVTELSSQLPPIVADSNQLHQVLLNLCVNARDAMPAGGRLRIGTNVVDASVVRQRFPSALSDRYVAIEVRDTGTGMDEATKARIFEPFFTTKESGKGTGLGLAVVFGVIQTHKGFIDVESEVGAGTAFRVYLPLEAAKPTTAGKQKEDSTQMLRGTETILYVEDESLLYETAAVTLAHFGYKVLYAKDGIEALDVYKHHASEIDLVFTDIDLPKLSGEKLVKALLEIRPKLKIIFASGYMEPEARSELLRSGAMAFLAKPYEPLVMLSKIREIIDAKS